MDNNFAAAMMALSIPATFAIALAVDTLPSGRRITTLGRRLFNWYCGLKLWERLDS